MLHDCIIVNTQTHGNLNPQFVFSTEYQICVSLHKSESKSKKKYL